MGFLEGGGRWGGTLESSRPSLGLGQWASAPHPTAMVTLDQTSFCPLILWTQGPPPQWAGVAAARPLEEVGVISGPVPREQLTKML